MIDRCVDVRAESVGIDHRRARERGNRGICSNELTGAQGDQFADRYAVTCHDERLASVEGAHDVAAAVTEFALSDFASHNEPIVAHVLRLCVGAPRTRVHMQIACLIGVARGWVATR